MKILITDPSALNSPGTHANNMRTAFIRGYEDKGLEWQGEILHHVTLWDVATVQEVQPDMWIQSFAGLSTNLASVNSVYPILPVMPAGANTPGELISVSIPQPTLITGAGDIANETADNVEFIAPDPIFSDPQDYSSFASPFIAGQIAAIMDILGCNHWEARYRARMTGSQNGVWHETDGFGFINILNAVTYQGIIPPDPWYTWPVPVVAEAKGITKNVDTTFGGSTYNVIKGVAISNGSVKVTVNSYLDKTIANNTNKQPMQSKEYSFTASVELKNLIHTESVDKVTDLNSGVIDYE